MALFSNFPPIYHLFIFLPLGGAIGASVLVVILMVAIAMALKKKTPEKDVEAGEEDELLKSSSKDSRLSQMSR